MKITHLEVWDQRGPENFQDPDLAVWTDDSPAGELETKFISDSNGDWRLRIESPFCQIDFTEDGDEFFAQPIENFNKLGSPLFPVWLVDQEVWRYIPLDHARRLLRRDAPDWKIIIDDYAARRGQIRWRLQQTEPVCNFCGSSEWEPAYYRGAHLELCEDCMKSLRRRYFNKRNK